MDPPRRTDAAGLGPMAPHRPCGPAPDRGWDDRARGALPRRRDPPVRPDLLAATGPASSSTIPASTASSPAPRASPSARPTPSAAGTPTTCPTLLRIAARDIGRADPLRRRIAPLLVPFQRLGSAADAEHARRGAVEHRPALRPRQRHVRALPRPRGDDVFERVLRDRRPSRSSRPSTSASSGSATRCELKPSDHLLEIGTGWGGMAVHAASTRGCRVTTTTISREQREYAEARVDARPASRT